MRRFMLTVVLCLIAVTSAVPLSAAQPPRPLPDQQAFLREVRKHLDTDDDRQRGYM